MNFRALALVLVLAALGLFAMLNWAAFAAPTALTLGFAEVTAPLGLTMLLVTGVVSALFIVYIVYQQAGVILEARRFAKELKAQRELADQAEASRFTELRSFLEGELHRIEHDLQQRFDESSRTLSACIGEVDDKIERLLKPRAD